MGLAREQKLDAEVRRLRKAIEEAKVILKQNTGNPYASIQKAWLVLDDCDLVVCPLCKGEGTCWTMCNNGLIKVESEVSD